MSRTRAAGWPRTLRACSRAGHASREDPCMVKHFDHVTFVVQDVAKAKAFFALLGFAEDKDVVIAGPKFARYMRVEGIEAEHVTLVLAGASPRTEIQLLKYRHPAAAAGAGSDPTRPG